MNKHTEDLVNIGYTIIPSLINNEFATKINESMSRSYDLCREIQVKNGIDTVTDGTIHHLIASSDELYLELINKICKSSIFSFIKDYFGGNYIINSCGGVINLPLIRSYVTNMHRDIRFFSGDFPLMLNMLIMLDNINIDNGALYLLAGSHKNGDRPIVEDFFKASYRAVGRTGDVLLFNSNLWHAAGVNQTADITREITITFTKPFMKQQLDYPRAIGYNKLEKMSLDAQQIIGYFARTPSDLEEWYQPPNKRFYRPGQD
jgi:ectoine hydroxylase-related dioxygenase (phytanoyl-CoA dioxygenase family)